jgi:hypothetical protein
MRTVISESAIAGSRLYACFPTARYNSGLVADWVTISALATAGGTLVLAGTTYASVRSANRAARVAETSLLAGLRPLMMQSTPEDRALDAGFMDSVTVHVPGGGAGVEIVNGNVYIAISLRNVGPGIGVLHGGYVYGEVRRASAERAPLEAFRMLSRDLYIPPGKIGFWQIAYREEDEGREEIVEAVRAGRFTIDLLYGDYEGGQRVVSRFGVFRDGDAWTLSVVRHWQVDRPNPR